MMGLLIPGSKLTSNYMPCLLREITNEQLEYSVIIAMQECHRRMPQDPKLTGLLCSTVRTYMTSLSRGLYLILFMPLLTALTALSLTIRTKCTISRVVPCPTEEIVTPIYFVLTTTYIFCLYALIRMENNTKQ